MPFPTGKNPFNHIPYNLARLVLQPKFMLNRISRYVASIKARRGSLNDSDSHTLSFGHLMDKLIIHHNLEPGVVYM